MDRPTVRRVRRELAKAARAGKLRPIAYSRGKVIGWVGDAGVDGCPCCLLLAQEEETPRSGTEPRLCNRCGQVIWLPPEERRRGKKVVCYRCFMQMSPRSADPPGLVH